MTTHYHTLGVHRHASLEDLSLARARLAREHHPDRGGDAARMAEINVAYDTLTSRPERYLAQLRSTHRDCPACGGKAGAWKSKGFHKREFHPCEACAGSGLVLKKARK